MKKKQDSGADRFDLVASTSMNPPSSQVVRLAWPRIMFPEDVAAALQVGVDGAARALMRGRFGPTLLVAGRVAVRREDFADAIEEASRALPPEDIIPEGIDDL